MSSFFFREDQGQEQERRFILIFFIDENHFKKGKYGTTQF